MKTLMRYQTMISANFRNAKDLHIKSLGLEDKGMEWDPNSKYARAARLGLCFKCFREDTDPTHRPRHLVFAYCQECMTEMATGVEKIELRNRYEVHKWFKE